MNNKEDKNIFRYFIPQYDEIALFAMSFTCVLLLIAGVLSNHKDMGVEYPREYDPRVIVATLIFLAGFAMSVYHAFIDRPKTLFEKYCMLFFAVLLNAFSGIMAGAYALANSSSWFVVFPIMNITSSVVLFFMYRTGVLNESNISDQHASLGQIALTALVVLILFGICHSLLKLLWIETLSICLIYATNLLHLIQSLVFRVTPNSHPL